MSLAGQEMDEVYSDMRDECERLELHSRRADENAGSGVVLREIADLIEQADFIVCDLTRERPNFYYELRYAHGVGNEAMDILLIAKEGTILHFDISPLRVNYYSSREHFAKHSVASTFCDDPANTQMEAPSTRQRETSSPVTTPTQPRPQSADELLNSRDLSKTGNGKPPVRIRGRRS